MNHQETLRAAYDAWNRSDIETLLQLVHPSGEIRPILGANLEANVYRGHDGTRQWMEDLQGEWETFQITLTEIVQRGDRLLCPFEIHARGRVSGAVIDGEFFHVIDMRDGLVVRLQAFREREDAQRALDAT